MATTIIHQQSHGIMDFSKFENAWKACEFIAKSSFCPKDYKDKAGDVLCAIQYGAEIGLQPMQALQNVAVINGKPCVYGDTLLALCQSSSECEYICETFDENTQTAICRVKRKNHPEVVKTFSLEDAKTAGLIGDDGKGKQGPWRLYPKRMLQMRARGFGLRDTFAFLLRGIITAEEAKDYPVPQKQFQKVIPINSSVPVIEQPQEMSAETKHRLLSLMEAVYLTDEEVQTLKTWAKVSQVEDMSEDKALKAIARLESKLSETMKQDSVCEGSEQVIGEEGEGNVN